MASTASSAVKTRIAGTNSTTASYIACIASTSPCGATQISGKWLQQRPTEPIRWILHESPARRRQHADRAAAVALEERRHRSTGGVVGERRFHLEQSDRPIGGQFVADRHSCDAAADDQHVVRVHQRSLPLAARPPPTRRASSAGRARFAGRVAVSGSSRFGVAASGSGLRGEMRGQVDARRPADG